MASRTCTDLRLASAPRLQNCALEALPGGLYRLHDRHVSGGLGLLATAAFEPSGRALEALES